MRGTSLGGLDHAVWVPGERWRVREPVSGQPFTGDLSMVAAGKPSRNSSSDKKEWDRFTRMLLNPKRCPMGLAEEVSFEGLWLGMPGICFDLCNTTSQNPFPWPQCTLVSGQGPPSLGGMFFYQRLHMPSMGRCNR